MATAHTRAVTWLLYNVEQCPSASIKVPVLYDAYQTYCQQFPGMLPASRDVIAVCVMKLFPACQKKLTKHASERAVTYVGLNLKVKVDPIWLQDNSVIDLPTFCTLELGVPTYNIIDGKVAYVVIQILCGKLRIKFHDIEIPCEKLGIGTIVPAVDNFHVQALLRLAEYLPICKGVEKDDRGRDNENLPNVFVNNWSYVGNEQNVSVQVRSNTCEAVRSFIQDKQLCVKCKHKFRWDKNPSKRPASCSTQTAGLNAAQTETQPKRSHEIKVTKKSKKDTALHSTQTKAHSKKRPVVEAKNKPSKSSAKDAAPCSTQTKSRPKKK